MDGELLLDSESLGEVKKAPAGFSGLAVITVVEHGARQADRCPLARRINADLARRINADLGMRITMADLFKAPTVADLDRRRDQMADTRT